MTKEEIINRVRDELDDNGISYYSTADLNDSFDDGYNEVVLFSRPLEKMMTVDLADDTVYYNLYEETYDFFHVFAIWSTSSKSWLLNKDVSYFKEIRWDWELATGNPDGFAVINFQYIGLFPHPATPTSTDQMEIFYKANAMPLTNQESPGFPEQYQIVLQYYCMKDLLEQAEEISKASIYAAKYQDALSVLERYVNSRTFPDRINILREQFSGGSFYGR